MKLLYLSLDPRQPYGGRTGGSTHMREMVRALGEEGHEVRVMAAGAQESNIAARPAAKSRNALKSIVPNKLWLLARDLNDIRQDRKQESKIEEAAGQFKPQVVYERNSYLYASGARAAARMGIPYFMEINAPTVEERIGNFGAPLAAWHRRIEAFQRMAAAGIIVVSDPLKQYLLSAGVDRKKIQVVPNGVRPDRFESGQKGNEVREKLGLAGPVIGFVGSLASYHGLDRLFKAMASVREIFPDARALIVGGGPLLEDARKRAAGMGLGEAVVFTGEVEPDAVPAYISAFDVAVLPETAEYCSPIKLFEYGAAAVPIIAPRTQPVEAILGPKGNGVLLDPDSSLADAVLSMLKDRDKALKMGESFRKRVLDNYTWRHAAVRVIRFIEERLA